MSSPFLSTAHWLDFLAGREVGSPPAATSRSRTGTLPELKRAIEAARRVGDPEGLWNLQTEYRKRADVCSADRGMPVLPVRMASSAPTQRASTTDPHNAAPNRVYRPPSPDDVRGTAGAVARIRAEARLEEGLERCGGLYSFPGDRLRIQAASASDNAVRTSHSVQFHLGDRVDFERNFGKDLVRVGDWHSHPGTERDSRPSGAYVNGQEGDMEAWAASRAVLENQPDFQGDYIGIIVTRGASWLAPPELHAYIVSRDKLTRVLHCESARLVED